MELAVSNIAWTNEEEGAIAEKLRELGVKHVEIAPTKIWEDPTSVTRVQAQAYVDWWKKYDIEVSAFQSILFARPDLKLFEGDENRREGIEYLTSFLSLADMMDVEKLVFGSPKNRQRDDVPIEQANEIAINFFSELGRVATGHSTVLCLEPNAPQYNCDFVTNAAEGVSLVHAVDSPGFRLHLDTACMSLAGDDLGDSIRAGKDILEHFHISSPMLGQVEARDGVDHTSAATALKEVGYSKLVSIEMRPGDVGTNVDRVEGAVRFAQSIYFT